MSLSSSQSKETSLCEVSHLPPAIADNNNPVSDIVLVVELSLIRHSDDSSGSVDDKGTSCWLVIYRVGDITGGRSV